MDIQRKGIDSKLTFTPTNYEVKCRDYDSRRFMSSGGDILLETEMTTSYGGTKRGWYYTTEADYVAYCWWNPKKTDIYEGYLIRIQDPRLRNWFEKNGDSYETKKALTVAENGREWWTYNRVVPVKDFPPNTLIPFIKEGQLSWGFHKNGLEKFL